jgi:DNA-directed RNA polymerase subunit RPC12/RpoP
MVEQVVRCPYCLEGEEFKPMADNANGRFMCAKCGHLAIPDQRDFRCFCWHCSELRTVGG